LVNRTIQTTNKTAYCKPDNFPPSSLLTATVTKSGVWICEAGSLQHGSTDPKVIMVFCKSNWIIRRGIANNKRMKLSSRFYPVDQNSIYILLQGGTRKRRPGWTRFYSI
ncbi:hypothetical protein RvY_13758, partial [Ramazzottius varieornatus]